MKQKETERIKDFISIAEKVRQSRFITENQGANYSLSVELGKPVTQTVTGFDENDLRSMLLDLRKFTLEKDGVRFTDICDLLLQSTSDQTIIKNVNACREQYDKLMQNSAIKLVIDGTVEDNMKILKTWFYGHYFHEQPNHKNNLVKLGIGTQLHKFNFVQAVDDLSVLSCILANNAKLVLNQEQN
ncbi:MAG TPA: hypothetical protein VEC13_00155 [Candidatus Paceibacterota bacterium]|nr:hypothetical protein [Candidatus Paceibacterota bacterium]